MLQLIFDQDNKRILSDEEIAIAQQADIIDLGNNNFHLIDGTASNNISILNYDKEEKIYTIRINGKICQVKVQDKYDLLLAEMGMGGESKKKINHIKAPMPGLIFEISVKEGDTIQKGDKVLILEAMKMENLIKSAGTGVIKKVLVEKGQAVEKNQILIELA